MSSLNPGDIEKYVYVDDGARKAIGNTPSSTILEEVIADPCLMSGQFDLGRFIKSSLAYLNINLFKLSLSPGYTSEKI